MTPMAPTVPPRPILPPSPFFPADPARTSPQFARRVRMVPGPGAPAKARAEVAAAIRAWDVPVDLDAAILLTSELVTNALTHAAAPVFLAITADVTGLRVDVHDASPALPCLRVPAFEDERESGRGLLLVMSLSAGWGFYRTRAGKAVYFTLDARTVGDQAVTGAQERAESRSVS